MSAGRIPSALALALVLLPLAGCLGYPPGTIRPGDTVTVTYTATDLATGKVLARDQTATFVAGSGASGLGRDLERAVLGHRTNDTLSLESRGDAGRGFNQVVEAQQVFDSRDIVQTYNTSAFEDALKEKATVGMAFSAFGYNATVTDVTPALVTFRLTPRDGARQGFPEYGLTMVDSTQGGKVVRTLEPTPGVVFTVGYAGQIALQALQADGTSEPFPAGTYKVLPAAGGHLRFSYSAGTATALLEKDVRFEAKIVAVEPGVRTAPVVEGCRDPAGTSTANAKLPRCYGARNSPQLDSDPAKAFGA
ncbi:MAG TPA: hypothetical protein VM286_10445 [Candidatus Thermoplasmatota archaeon]|nr:hypothetical protein [Candidatus Thermoplasmatota archaeon]